MRKRLIVIGNGMAGARLVEDLIQRGGRERFEMIVFGDEPCEILAKRKRICFIAPCYGAVRAGRPLAVPGSTGFLEIAVNGGSAAAKFSLRLGDQVGVRPRIKSR